MAENFKRIMFTPGAVALQEAAGSRASYTRMEGEGDAPDALDEVARDFIARRDSFYMASVTETGWPYVQHRGGPPGFLRVLDEHRIGFADYRGNRQYVSTANLISDDRVSLFLMDYPNRRRLKLIGRARIVDDPIETAALMTPGYKAVPERGFIVAVEGIEWNCPQHITPRYTEIEIRQLVHALTTRIEQLEAENRTLREEP
ncbi:pyridoxamine 5'-phosphate oxidase family protein [Sphingomonas cavernae]|uniref:Pyridoxamine 5'-phosphate oxidase family protein n=1 Tax=Sphingomonas cavernae TaxID=2320861 RepID=A0A418WL35_9SPHN|nr:pyridoxamine 5'-phosphate oxidase family protein [Sphingomonas cavernae]RJF90662.1 pyridoxamine 5'-phosphate oxidase family protein [Sphingomonas cavernae]